MLGKGCRIPYYPLQFRTHSVSLLYQNRIQSEREHCVNSWSVIASKRASCILIIATLENALDGLIGFDFDSVNGREEFRKGIFERPAVLRDVEISAF